MKPPSAERESEVSDASQAIPRGHLSEDSFPLPLPLCVNLDGTVVRSDLFLESLLQLLKKSPACIFLIPKWLLEGNSVLKDEVSRRVILNPATLPYNQELLSWLRSQRDSGRTLWLCSGTAQRFASAISDHLQIFHGVLASSRREHFVGKTKALALAQRFGSRNFDYCGDDRKDTAVWQHANAGVVVGRLQSPAVNTAHLKSVMHIATSTTPKARATLFALRPHQWAKNALVLVPLFLSSHRNLDLTRLAAGALAFVAFSFAASSAYVLNDLLDLESDRAHIRKARRPFAAGHLSAFFGLALSLALFLAAAVSASSLPTTFCTLLALYYVLTLAYSFKLKTWVLADALALTSLYTLRLVSGSYATHLPTSFWMLLFSVFLFLSLAFAKRFAEFDRLRRSNQSRSHGRGYAVEDLPALQSMGTAAGYLSVLILALYISLPDVASGYQHPHVIWVLCSLLLCWISRIWIKAQRGELNEDPVVFAVTDRISLGIGALSCITIIAAG